MYYKVIEKSGNCTTLINLNNDEKIFLNDTELECEINDVILLEVEDK